jgi:hypothetical protein
VVDTKGFLRIWSIDTDKIVAEFELLRQDENQEQTSLVDKILRAKLDFHKRPFKPEDQEFNFDLALAYSTQSYQNLFHLAAYEQSWSVA